MFENAPEKTQVDNSPPHSSPNLNDVIMSENPYEPNDDNMKIEEKKIMT